MSEPLAITAVGLVSSVGLGIRDSCAAIRAGISRSREIPHFSILDDEEHELVPLQGYPVPELTDGFGPSARWLIMSRKALGDLRERHPTLDNETEYWSRCGVVFVLPVLDDARYFYALPCHPDTIWGSYLNVLFEEPRLPVDPDHRELIHIGAAGIGKAFETTQTWLDADEVDRVLIVSADSLLDAWSLDWLANTGRLKNSANPTGLAPGEAAVMLLVEQSSDVRESESLGRTKSIVFEDVDNPYLNLERRQGRELADVLRRAVAPIDMGISGDIYINLNGENWRAEEFSNALVSLSPELTGQHRVILSATSVGDIGAASGALHIACAMRSFARGYSTSSHAWILSTSDYGEVSALCLEAT